MNPTIKTFQTGFRKHHNTQTVLLKLTDDIREGKGNKLATLLLQFDSNKAFDTITPSRLLMKLKILAFSKNVLMILDISLWSFSMRIIKMFKVKVP